jgi:hypothetical protein
MGASITPYWKGIKQRTLKGAPGFYNDDSPWANWFVKVVEDDDLRSRLIRLGAGALLSHTTEGLKDPDVDWESPDSFISAAAQVSQALVDGNPDALELLRAYGPGYESPSREFLQDLADVATIARWALGHKVSQMTLAYNW